MAVVQRGVVLEDAHRADVGPGAATWSGTPAGTARPGPGRPGTGGDLRSLVPDRAVGSAARVVGAPDPAQVDELELFLALDHVIGLEVAVEQPQAVQVTQGAQAFE